MDIQTAQQLAGWIAWLPAIAVILCGICCMKRSLRPLAAPVCILALFSSFVITMLIRQYVTGEDPQLTHVTMFQWIHVGGLRVDFAYLFDPLTIIMLMVVTGIGTLVAIYAAGYMGGDRGYARFFAGVSLFIFAMTNLVMADNLLLLYLGWEGVGLCSYLLIGYYYDKPSAVAAAKKAFIVNRIGDLGFAIGIFLTYTRYDTVVISEVLAMAGEQAAQWQDYLIPFMLMLGAFGKSAQIPLFVWLPDAMEGPTPVSALIHAATMVTAGVYMIARLLPIFELSPYALPTVAVIGTLTAMMAATIAICQYDIKRIYAYSTISQLGYMFLGVGALSTAGGVFHLFTHAFFKALLFLTAGSVMHAMAGQLDLRKMSGLRKKMPVTCWLMFFGCLALAGFPLTAGFYSKDMILAATLERGIVGHQPLFTVLAIVGLITALLTAFYTFRLWFRVFMGPMEYEMGQENHDHTEHEVDAHVQVEHIREPHEVSWLMNGPLVVLALGAVFAGWYAHEWIETMVEHSTARPTLLEHGQGHASLNLYFWQPSIHTFMVLISSLLAIMGISAAAYYHWFKREAADAAAERYAGIVKILAGKYYIDEIYDAMIVKPLHLLGEICFMIDRLIIDGLVALVGFIPRAAGLAIRPAQNGALQGYGLGMALGAAAVLLLVLMAMN